jgi:hypothetical protein
MSNNSTSITSSLWFFPGLRLQTCGLLSALSSIFFRIKKLSFSELKKLCVSCPILQWLSLMMVRRHIGLIWRSSGPIYHSLLFNSFSLWVIGQRVNEWHTLSLFGKRIHTHIDSSDWLLWTRVYGLLAVYLLVCSFWLTAQAFQVGHDIKVLLHSLTYIPPSAITADVARI